MLIIGGSRWSIDPLWDRSGTSGTSRRNDNNMHISFAEYAKKLTRSNYVHRGECKMSETFNQQHVMLIEIGRDIVRAAAKKTAASIAEVARLRLALSRAVQSHVTAELALLPQTSDSLHGADTQAILSKYHGDLLAWSKLLIACNAQWPLAAIASDPEGFLRAYRPILQALEQRVQWEEDEFYPAILSLEHLQHAAL